VTKGAASPKESSARYSPASARANSSIAWSLIISASNLRMRRAQGKGSGYDGRYLRHVWRDKVRGAHALSKAAATRRDVIYSPERANTFRLIAHANKVAGIRWRQFSIAASRHRVLSAGTSATQKTRIGSWANVQRGVFLAVSALGRSRLLRTKRVYDHVLQYREQ
jgi:hypothetical protein